MNYQFAKVSKGRFSKPWCLRASLFRFSPPLPLPASFISVGLAPIFAPPKSENASNWRKNLGNAFTRFILCLDASSKSRHNTSLGCLSFVFSEQFWFAFKADHHTHRKKNYPCESILMVMTSRDCTRYLVPYFM